MQIVSNVALISINETMIIQLISFLIFLFLITRIMIRPLRKVMWERKHHVEKIQQEIGESRKIVAFCRQELDGRMRAAKREARALSRQLEAQGSHEAEKVLESAFKEIAAAREATARQIAAGIEKAKVELAGESETLATVIVEKVLGRRLNP